MLLTLLQQAETKECSIVAYPAHSRHVGPIDSTNANSSILLMLIVEQVEANIFHMPLTLTKWRPIDSTRWGQKSFQ